MFYQRTLMTGEYQICILFASSCLRLLIIYVAVNKKVILVKMLKIQVSVL